MAIYKKETTTLYNVLFPIWFLILFPIGWIVVLPANFIIDSLVLLISLKLLKISGIKQIYKKTILKVWCIGFAADLTGACILFVASDTSSFWSEYLRSVSWNPFDNWYAILYVCFAIIVSGIVIYFANLKISFSGLDLSLRNRRIAALALAIVTAPYVLLYPSSLMNGSAWNKDEVLTNHIVKMDLYHLEVVANHGKPDAKKEKQIVMSILEQEMKDAINQAEKISGNITINSEPEYTLLFYNRDYTENVSIPIRIQENKGYFTYKNAWYAVDQNDMMPFLKAVTDAEKARAGLGFVIEPDPSKLNFDGNTEQLDKEGNKRSDYPIFEDSSNKYYYPDDKLFFTLMIKFDDGKSLDAYKALESGLIVPQALIDHGVKLIAEPRE